MDVESDDWTEDEIFELEQLFAVNQHDKDWLITIQEELQERNIEKTIQQVVNKGQHSIAHSLGKVFWGEQDVTVMSPSQYQA